MSERHPEQHKTTEKLNSVEARGHNEQLRQHHEKEASHAEKHHGSENHVERLKQHVEQQAISGKEHAQSEKETPQQHPVLVNKHLKDVAFTRALTRARKKLSAPNRAFSKVAHNPAVDRTSEFVGKTIARPTSMLWGAIFAFVGTSALLWITRHYGYEYNYLAAILLFFGGAAVGLIGEGLWRTFIKKES